jgi:hypothetical protein
LDGLREERERKTEKDQEKEKEQKKRKRTKKKEENILAGIILSSSEVATARRYNRLCKEKSRKHEKNTKKRLLLALYNFLSLPRTTASLAFRAGSEQGEGRGENETKTRKTKQPTEESNLLKPLRRPSTRPTLGQAASSVLVGWLNWVVSSDTKNQSKALNSEQQPSTTLSPICMLDFFCSPLCLTRFLLCVSLS